MAIGLTPKYQQETSLEDLSSQQYLTLAIEVTRSLEWKTGYISENRLIAYTGFSFASSGEEFILEIDGSQVWLKSQCQGSQIVDWGKNKGNVDDFIEAFTKLKATLSPEELALRYDALKENIVSKEQDQEARRALTGKGKLDNFLSIFKPTDGYFVTPILININIAIFLLMILTGVSFIEPDSESLIHWGANMRMFTLEGEWWRLITNCFLHIGVFHLLMNMYALLYIGILLEPLLGRLRFASAYLLTGVVASLSSLWWHEMTISAGASGAIFGMYGVFLAMLTTNLIDKNARKELLTSIGFFVGYNLIFGMKDGVDNAAHIGGLVSGIVIGYAFYTEMRKGGNEKIRIFIIGVFSVMVVIATLSASMTLPNDMGTYQRNMAEFAAKEVQAMEVFRMPDNSPVRKTLIKLDEGLLIWKQNIQMLNETDKLAIPERLHDRNKKLIKYCTLRIKSYGLLKKTLLENSDKYQSQIRQYTEQMNGIISKLAEDQK